MWQMNIVIIIRIFVKKQPNQQLKADFTYKAFRYFEVVGTNENIKEPYKSWDKMLTLVVFI